jgi:hypothetical protein
MKHPSLAATDFVKKPKQTRREKFLLEMEGPPNLVYIERTSHARG